MFDIAPSPDARVGIIGLGQGGQALAVHLSSRGYIPSIYCFPGHRKDFDFIKQQGSVIRSSHKIVGTFPVRLINDLSEFVRSTDQIIIVTLSNAHNAILKSLQSHDLRRHNLVALPGGGSFAAKARQLGIKARNIVESCTLPYASRCPSPGEVAILYIKKSFPLAAIKPLHDHERLLLSDIFAGRVEWRRSVLGIWLNCTNPVVHCPPMILNAGRVESGNRFYLYGDGITPSVARATTALDDERIAIAAAYGEVAPTVLDWTNIWYDASYPDWVTFARESTPHNKHGLAPTRLKGHRHFDEDLKDTMVFWYCLGRLKGLDLPIMRSFIALASAMVGEDYLESGTTLKSLGMAALGAEEVADMFGVSTSRIIPPERESHSRRFVMSAGPSSTTCLPLSPGLIRLAT